MLRLLRELDRRDGTRSRRRREAGDAWRRLTAAALAALLIACVGLTFAHKQYGVRITASGLAWPRPLGAPPDVETGVGSFRFMRTQPGSSELPVAYDPCRPVEYELNLDLAPAGSQDIIESAVEAISQASGLRFEPVGTTHRLPEEGPAGLRTGPVLIAWTTPRTVPDLAGRVAGVGGSTAMRDDYSGRLRYVTGTVSLDASQLDVALTRPDGADLVRAIVMHELGHLLGLDHVDDRHELMYADNVGKIDLGPGDREGLAALGAGQCFP
jgi:hypothetical protein